ncbi:MAG: protein kinase [Candidatus Zixiibacteriota bacterium]
MLSSGQSLAQFRIVRMLGEGGMGQVYLADDQNLHRQVALKVLSPEFVGDMERLERFQREAKTAAQISHPHVMAIYDLSVAPDPASGRDLSFIVMEYVKGRSLSEYLKGRSGDLAAVARQAEKIASGLAAAHKINVVHRDIKADNILVDEDDQPKILDFGLAKPLDPVSFGEKQGGTQTVSRELTKAGKIMGTVSYMSPEQIRGEAVDTRSDIFSFGVLLYRMATGEFPFAATTEVSTLAKILESRHESPRVKNDAVPPEMERIIDKCLQKDANDRYQDTRDLVVDLRNLRRQYDSGVTDRVSTVTDRPTESRRNFFVSLGWKQIVLIMFVLSLAWAFIMSRSRPDGSGSGSQAIAGENALAILSFDNKTGDATLDWLQTGLPEILLTDLSQDPSVNLISRQRILDNLNEAERKQMGEGSHEAWTEAAKGMGATTVLTGSYYKLGNRIRIDARLEDLATGKILLGEKVVGDDPFGLVDSLTDKIAASLNLRHPVDARSVATYTSSSPEAYRKYLEGMELFSSQLHDQAIAKFNEAIAIDSTFALPYMRIGMASAFQSKMQVGAHYLALAKKFQDKLPPREQTLLDIYADIWLNRKFNDAFAKMEAMVRSYPDDYEARTIYGILINEFQQDTTKAFAQFDSVLATNPGFQMALGYLAEQNARYGHYDVALEHIGRIKKSHPESPLPYRLAADVYRRMLKISEAITEYQTLLSKHPEETDALVNLSFLYIRKRDFRAAEEALESYRTAAANDPYKLEEYWDDKAILVDWSGRFNTALQYQFERLNQARRTGDSMHVVNALNSIANRQEQLGRIDSSLYYYELADSWTVSTQISSYPIQLVAADPKNEPKARPLFKADVSNFRSRIPSDLWPIADALEEIFEAHCAVDTARLIKGLRAIIDVQKERGSSNIRELGYTLIANGQYKEGRELLEQFVSGKHESSSGYYYPMNLYMLGKASEGLGENQDAVKYYTEMLSYWGTPEVELKEIKDARARLAKLTS